MFKQPFRISNIYSFVLVSCFGFQIGATVLSNVEGLVVNTVYKVTYKSFSYARRRALA